MVKPKKDKVATETFVWRVVNSLEEKIEKRIDSMETNMDNRFNKVMVHLVDIAGKFKRFDEEQTILSERSRNHTDSIEKLEKAVFKSS